VAEILYTNIRAVINSASLYPGQYLLANAVGGGITQIGAKFSPAVGVYFKGERVGTTFPFLKCLRAATNAVHCRVLHIQSPRQGRPPGAWTETPTFAWLTSVPAVFLFTKRPLWGSPNTWVGGQKPVWEERGKFPGSPFKCHVPSAHSDNWTCSTCWRHFNALTTTTSSHAEHRTRGGDGT